MYHIDFKRPIHVFFIGIGGISMSGLAEILLSASFRVSGSDLAESELTRHLCDKGAAIIYGQRGDNLAGFDDIDLVVYTAAIKEDNPEYLALSGQGIPFMPRAELLGQIMRNYDCPIAIAGTHGKTTTTGMVSLLLRNDGRDPTVTIGGILGDIGGNLRIGKSQYFVTEACEYTNSFLSFYPKVAFILNIEEDHLDFFKDIGEIRASFAGFARLLPKDGLLVINGDIDDLSEITEGVDAQVITFGKSAACDLRVIDADYDESGKAGFSFIRKNASAPTRIKLDTRGEHNILNALASIALADWLGIGEQVVKKTLSEFSGTKRRFEEKGTVAGFSVVDDYAHHPSEIRATLKAARRYPHRELVVIFQPHTYSRTKAFLGEFAAALGLADKVILVDIYAAREKNTYGISSKDLQAALAELNIECYYIPTADGFSEAVKFIFEILQKNDLLITMGAGDVVNIADILLEKNDSTLSTGP